MLDVRDKWRMKSLHECELYGIDPFVSVYRVSHLAAVTLSIRSYFMLTRAVK